MLTFFSIIVALVVLAAIAYGGSRLWAWVSMPQNRAKVGMAVSAFVAMVSVVFPVAPSYAQSTLTFDLTPFFDSLNVYLPIFIGLFAIVGGIAGAMALARYVINAIVSAFKGGSL